VTYPIKLHVCHFRTILILNSQSSKNIGPLQPLLSLILVQSSKSVGQQEYLLSWIDTL